MRTFSFICLIVACSFIVNAQDCNSYFAMEEGITSQITSYDKKDRPVAVVDYEIKKVSNNNGIKIAEITSTVKDEKGKLIATSNYEVSCKGDKISIDFRSMMSPQLIEQYKDMELEITGNNIEIPNNLNVGDQLPDSNMEMTMNMGGMNMKMNVAMINRSVTGEETIKTPAGTFECVVITYTSEFKMGITKSGTAKQWLSKGIGMVKQEDYNGNGNLTSSSLLTAFNK
ncbi:hypothetical protein [Gillisia sp. CAL575]|uniref:TapB family protein n=1 Tax=Gillisia sp. CAL575 TaxID=985255 RepID=UPI00054FE006|nr:hypothetical protein [Gillisia sp. CAL575]